MVILEVTVCSEKVTAWLYNTHIERERIMADAAHNRNDINRKGEGRFILGPICSFF